MIAKVSSGTVAGIDGYGVDVEVDLASGLPSFSIVGLPDAAVRESRERVTAALRNCGFKLPLKRITVNLAPAGMRKEGAAFDLPIALGILLASGQTVVRRRVRTLFMGELALDGGLNKVRGGLPVACYARHAGFERVVVPVENGREISLVPDIEVMTCDKLEDVVALLEDRPCAERSSAGGTGTVSGTGRSGDGAGAPRDDRSPPVREWLAGLDYAEVAGQYTAKRGFQIAAAGGHHILMTGPPGSGKTMLARRLPGILPPLDDEEMLECAKISSVIGGSGVVAGRERPFRAPHHSASDAGLIGGGRYASPGEITLAHNGILFLDELTEFRRNVLETLRQPIEEGVIAISRAGMKYTYPARFQLVAAMNPCPCGYAGSDGGCRCTPLQVRRYLAKISGPLMDRIAIHLPVMAVPVEELAGPSGAPVPTAGTDSRTLRDGVISAVEIQSRRYDGVEGLRRNADLSLPMIKRFCNVTEEAALRLDEAQRKCGFSARTRKNVLLVARTIADIEGEEEVLVGHVCEAVMFRVPAMLDGACYGSPAGGSV